MKVARAGSQISSSIISNESNFHKNLSKILGLNNFVPKFLGETYFGKSPVIKTEYISQSIEDYVIMIPTNKSSLGIRGIILQIFDAVHLMHSEAKLLLKNIKPSNFRIQDG